MRHEERCPPRAQRPVKLEARPQNPWRLQGNSGCSDTAMTPVHSRGILRPPGAAGDLGNIRIPRAPPGSSRNHRRPQTCEMASDTSKSPWESCAVRPPLPRLRVCYALSSNERAVACRDLAAPAARGRGISWGPGHGHCVGPLGRGLFLVLVAWFLVGFVLVASTSLTTKAMRVPRAFSLCSLNRLKFTTHGTISFL